MDSLARMVYELCLTPRWSRAQETAPESYPDDSPTNGVTRRSKVRFSTALRKEEMKSSNVALCWLVMSKEVTLWVDVGLHSFSIVRP